MDKTTNYQLNQWERTDRVLMEDFNADNAKIDAALGELAEKTDGKADAAVVTALSGQLDAAKATIPKIAVGTYTGDGAESRTIYLGFTPKAVFVCNSYGYTYNMYNDSPQGGLAVTGQAVSQHHIVALEIVANGFRVAYKYLSSSESIATNYSNTKYNYIAIG